MVIATPQSRDKHHIYFTPEPGEPSGQLSVAYALSDCPKPIQASNGVIARSGRNRRRFQFDDLPEPRPNSALTLSRGSGNSARSDAYLRRRRFSNGLCSVRGDR